MTVEFNKTYMFVARIFESEGLTTRAGAEFQNSYLFHLFSLYSLSTAGKLAFNLVLTRGTKMEHIARRLAEWLLRPAVFCWG